MKKVIALCCLMVCAILWLFAGGIVVSNYWSYGGQSNVTTGQGLAFTLWIDTHVEQRGIPFVFLHYEDKVPYSIRLNVYDHDAKTFSRLLLDEVVIEYPGGEVVEIVSPRDQWTKSFEKYVYYNSSSAGVIQHESLKVDHYFTGVIGKPRDFRLKMRGRFLLKDGSQIEASVDEMFRTSRDCEVTTGWGWLSRL